MAQMALAQNKHIRKPATGRLKNTALAALGAIAVLMTATCAYAQETKKTKTYQRNYYLSATYNPGGRSIELKIRTGCVSSTNHFLGNDFRFQVDEEKALITGTGGFILKTPLPKIVTADCGGARQLTFKLPDVDARRYTLVMNGKYNSVLDFTKSVSPARLFIPNRVVRNSTFLTKMQLASAYAPVNLDTWTSRSGANVMDLFRPITNTHPESLDGCPEMEITMRRDGNFLTVRITLLVYLDDSVSGGKYIGLVTRKDGNWYLESLWQQNLCARGPKAGQWSKQPCL